MKRYITTHAFDYQLILSPDFKEFQGEDPTSSMVKRCLKEHRFVEIKRRRNGTPAIRTGYGIVDIPGDIVGIEVLVSPTMTSLSTRSGQSIPLSMARLQSLRRIAPKAPLMIILQDHYTFVFEDKYNDQFLVHRIDGPAVIVR